MLINNKMLATAIQNHTHYLDHFREPEADHVVEQDVQQCCDRFLEHLATMDEEDQWVEHELGATRVHQLMASCAQPADVFEHWNAGPAYHCSFAAVSNPLFQMWGNHHDTVPEFDVLSEQLDEWTSQLVGRDGCYLKQLTAQSGCVCIWNDKDNDTFHFWGSRDSLQRARVGFHYHAAKFIYHNITHTVTFDDYAQRIHEFPTSVKWNQWHATTSH